MYYEPSNLYLNKMEQIFDSAQYLTQARIKKGLSQRQVAESVGIKLRNYQRYESGEVRISSASYRVGIALCELLDMDPFKLAKVQIVSTIPSMENQVDSQAPPHNNIQLIHTYLLKLGIPPYTKGFQYLVECIESAPSTSPPYSLRDIYVTVANNLGVTYMSIERSIRHVIQSAWSKSKEPFQELFCKSYIDVNERPTTTSLIRAILCSLNET